MPDRWIDLFAALDRAFQTRSGAISASRLAFIKACEDGLIRTRWRGHHIGQKPAIPRKDWAAAEIDVTARRVVRANGDGMVFIDVCEGDLDEWLSQQNARKKSEASPKRKGGRPSAADWDVIELALREEVTKRGFPDDGGPKDWRSQSDAERFVFGLTDLRNEHPSESTVRDHVREILNSIKAGN